MAIPKYNEPGVIEFSKQVLAGLAAAKKLSDAGVGAADLRQVMEKNGFDKEDQDLVSFAVISANIEDLLDDFDIE